MVGVFPVLYLAYKFIKRTKVHKAEEVDLFQNLAEIEDYERNYVPETSKYVVPKLHVMDNPLIYHHKQEYLCKGS
jgi:amino acid transporter